MSGSKDLIKGDERWIVEERKDGTNVGNWHWQELDCLPWAKQRLGELLAGREVLAGEGALWIKTTTVEAVTGECYVNRRKGKIIAGYELEVRIGWSGEARGEDGSKVYASALGSFVIEYLGDENADEDAEVKVTVRGDGGGAGDRMRQALLKPGVKLIQEGIRTFVSELRKGGPAADGKKPLAAATSVSGDAKAALAAAPAEVAKKEKPKVKKEKGRTIKIEQSFYCRPMDIYECLMDERRMKAATYSDASISREEGGSFSIFSGNIVGTNVKLIPGERIEQQWRFSNWEDGLFSNVKISISESDRGNTRVSLVHSGVPDEDKHGNSNVYEQTERGWRENIFHRIRTTFGYGV